MTDNATTDTRAWEGWVIMELMGHRRLAGLLSEEEIAGVGFLRLDIPGGNGTGATQYYRPGVVYGITPTTEATAREVAAIGRPAPVQRWELPASSSHRDEPSGYLGGADDDGGEPF